MRLGFRALQTTSALACWSLGVPLNIHSAAYRPTDHHLQSYLPAFLPSYLAPAFLQVYLPTCLPTCLPTGQPTYRPTCLPAYSRAASGPAKPERTHANQREGGRWRMIPASASSQERRTASEQGQGHRLQGKKATS